MAFFCAAIRKNYVFFKGFTFVTLKRFSPETFHQFVA